MIDRIKDMLAQLSLSQRFMLASLAILVGGLLGIGAWVQQQIETGVVHRTGATTALYVDSFVAPLLQDLAQAEELPPEKLDRLAQLLQNTSMGQQIVAFKVWNTRGRLIYSTDKGQIGRTFPMNEGLLRARLGQVESEISALDEAENAAQGALHDRLLETYSPVWFSGTNQVIAVAEFYQSADELDREIGVLQRRSWLVVGAAMLLMYLLLSGFVRSASDTITRQQAELGSQVAQLTTLLAQNQDLHGRVRRAAASVALLNESYLRRVGAELHDGPAQELGLSLLKLDALIGRIEKSQAQPAQAQANLAPGGPAGQEQEVLDTLAAVESSLQSALKETRAIAAGLSLPQLADLLLPETIARVVRAHERRTATRVKVELEDVPDEAPLPVKIAVYRLIQEALNNAYRHAGGRGQHVHVQGNAEYLLVEVSDAGPGFEPKQASAWNGRLGLSGMRERVESLGGRFEVDSQVGRGTTIRAWLPMSLEGASG